MAHITYRVSGRGPDGKRVSRKFRNSDAGREEARAFAGTLRDLCTVYDVGYRVGGREASKTFARRKDAEDFLHSVEHERQHGALVDPRGARTPLVDVAELWSAAKVAKRASSVACDRPIVTHHLAPGLGSRPIGSITEADVQALVDSWVAKLAASTVARQYSCLRAIFAYAVRAKIIAHSPCRDMSLPQVRLIDRPERSPDDLTGLADALGPDQAPMMWLGPVLGLRWGEAAGLTVAQVDMLGAKITVDRQLTRQRVLADPKSAASTRTLSVPQWLLDDLAALFARRGLTGADAGALVFVNSDGSALDYTNWRRRVWIPACEKAGLTGLRFHDLRTANATALVEGGVDPKTAQQRLGHSSVRVTLDLYARVTAEADRKAAELVGTKFRPRDARGMPTPRQTRRDHERLA